jgi:hypothetical protein
MSHGVPHLVQMHDKFAKQGLVVYSVLLDDPKDAKLRAAGDRYLTRVKVPFPLAYLDMPQKESFGKLRLESFPGVFVFNRANKYVKKMPETNDKGEQDEVDYDVIEKTVQSLLKE